MQLSRVLLSGLIALAAIAACASGEDAGPAPADAGESTVTEPYCTKYCNAQATAGTLQKSRVECRAECCKSVSGGCAADDAAAAPAEEPPADAGSDGAACAVPCGAGCCRDDRGCAANAAGTAVCVKACRTGADCTTGCCAPATDATGAPVGPYICKPNDGKDYHCCEGLFNLCSAPACCVTDANKNQFCARRCTSNANCGAARCIGLTFGPSTSCNGPTVCGI